MSVFGILGWVIFGGIVGWLAKLIHPGKENITWWGTILLGIVGSFVGGGFNWLLGWGESAISTSGFLMSVFGSVVLCFAYVNKDTVLDWLKSIWKSGGR